MTLLLRLSSRVAKDGEGGEEEKFDGGEGGHGDWRPAEEVADAQKA